MYRNAEWGDIASFEIINNNDQLGFQLLCLPQCAQQCSAS
jgi:hypothetical protein